MASAFLWILRCFFFARLINSLAEKGNKVSKAPFWIRPDLMQRTLYAEPINKLIRLKCLADGVPKPEIYWLKNGIPVKEVTRPRGLAPYKEKPKKFELYIPGMTLKDEGLFECVVKNNYGEIRHTFKISALNFVAQEPRLFFKSANQTVLEGMPVKLICRFKSDLATIIHWVRPLINYNHFNLKNQDHFESIKNSEGKDSIGEILEIKNTSVSDSGVYICAAQTSLGSTTESVFLNVLSIDEAIIEGPRNISVNEGQIAIFYCRTQIQLHKFISWIRYSNHGNKLIAKETEALKLRNVSTKDAGTYACIIGNVTKKIAELKVLKKKKLFPWEPFSVENLNSNQNFLAVFILLILASMLILTAFAIFKKYKVERYKKIQAIANAHSVTHWTKQIIIERADDCSKENYTLNSPIIRIETKKQLGSKSRSRLGSESTAITTVSEYELPFDAKWEIPRENINLKEILGEGAFGRVVLAEMKGIGTKKNSVSKVAVKMLKDDHSDEDLIDLVSEMDTLKMICIHGNNENIIKLFGVCTQNGPFYVIVEYAEHGNLRDFLRAISANYEYNDGYEIPNEGLTTITTNQLLSFARQVCKGMVYLASHKCIHRDLAARNILLTANYVVKIADFGLARNITAQDYYRKASDGRLPIKWMAPETLFERKYTVQSDVWSFGVLFWEIMSLGANPYPSVPSIEQLFTLLKNGYRMEAPPCSTTQTYTIMLNCWQENPVQRPSFSYLLKQIDNLFYSLNSAYLNMRLPTSFHISNHKKFIEMKNKMNNYDREEENHFNQTCSLTPCIYENKKENIRGISSKKLESAENKLYINDARNLFKV